MTKKRFIKLLISYGKQRNEAQAIAMLYCSSGFSYKEAYKDFMLKFGVATAFKSLSKSVKVFSDGIRKVAASANKLATAFIVLAKTKK